MRYHHIQELVTNKKLDVQKVDTEVNIIDNLTKQLPNQHFGTLRGQMGLLQADERNKAGSEGAEGAEGKSRIDTAWQVETMAR